MVSAQSLNLFIFLFLLCLNFTFAARPEVSDPDPVIVTPEFGPIHPLSNSNPDGQESQYSGSGEPLLFASIQPLIW